MGLKASWKNIFLPILALVIRLCVKHSKKAFIIHLERARSRADQVANLMAALPIPSKIVTAVDAQNLSETEVAQAYRRQMHQPAYPFNLSKNEVACLQSHRKAWAMLVDQGCDAGLILEDDACINGDFAAAFSLACEVMTSHSLIRFPHHQRENGVVIAQKGNTRLIQPQVVGLGQVACLIGREAAIKLLENTEVFDRPVDVWLQMFWLTQVRPLAILPSGIEEISSQLGGSTLHRKRTAIEKLHREILRPLYRWRLARTSRKYSERM